MTLHRFLTRLIWLSVVPLVLLTAWLTTEHVQHTQNQHNSDAHNMAQNLALSIDQHLIERIGALHMLALSPLIEQTTTPTRALYQEAQKFRQTFGGEVLLSDLEGRVLLATHLPFGVPLPKLPRPKGHSAARMAVQSGKPAVGDLFTELANNEPMVAIASPIEREGKTVLLLITAIETHQFQHYLDQVVLPRGWAITLLDGNGDAIARHDPSGMHRNNNGAGETTAKRFIVTSSTSPWSVMLEIPHDIYHAPLLKAWLIMALIMLGATLTGVLGGWLASRRLAHAVTALAGTSQAQVAAPNITEITAVRQLLDDSFARRDQAEAARRNSEQRFRAIFEQAAVGLSLNTPQGRLLLVNQKLCDILGYSADELQHCSSKDITHPDDQAITLTLVRQMLAGEINTCTIEKRYVRKDGSTLWGQLTVALARTSKGEPDHFISVVEDITESKQMKERLRVSDLALKAISQGVLITDAQGYAISANAAFLTITGYDEAEVLGQHSSFVAGPLTDTQTGAQIRHALCSGTDFSGEVLNYRKDTSTFWNELLISPVRDAQGQLTHFIGITRDVSERKQAEAEQQRLNRSLRLLSDCSIVLVRAECEQQLLDDLCRLIVQSGNYLMAWVGTPEHDSAKSVRMVAQFGQQDGYFDEARVSWDEQSRIGVGPIGLAIRTGLTQINQDYNQPQMAPWREAAQQRGYGSSLALALCMEGQVWGVLALYAPQAHAFDTQEVRLLEELSSHMMFGLQSLRLRRKLDRYRHQLEKRVTERTEKIAALNAQLMAKIEEAESANRAKDVFLATMSHELRTPLNAVVGLTGLLADSPLNRRQRDYADKIRLSAQALRALIDDILDFSKIEAGELQLEQAPFSLNAILRATAAVLGVGIGSKPIEALFEVAPNVPDVLLGDALRLQQILLNLTSNAIKFTPSGVIVVSVCCLSQDANEVTLQLAIRDTGIGIPKEQLGIIFDGFAQAHSSTSRLYGGSGLGLAISARLAKLMKGHISVESTLGEGSEFCLTLALAYVTATPEREKSAFNLRILIVDDHALARETLRQTCAAFGWQATAVDSGAAALAELLHSAQQDIDYDLVLLDWHMPDMDGIEMLHAAYETPDLGLPLVVLMASIFELEKAAAASDDCYLDGIVTKPITPASLFEAVTRAYLGEPSRPLLSLRHNDHRLTGMRLLVAEDNELNQEVIEQILQRAGAEVVMVSNGQEAVQAVRQAETPFNAVLMDLQMPVMDGYTATRIIREELKRTDLPIIAVTAFARPEDRETSRLAGMMGHVVKPLDVEDLLDLLLRQHTPMPTPAPEAATTLVPGLDLEAALKMFGGDRDKYAALLRQFIEHHGDDVVQARQLFNTDDIPGAARLIHDVRGMAGILRTPELLRCASDVENALLDGQTSEINALFDALQAALQTVTDALGPLDLL